MQKTHNSVTKFLLHGSHFFRALSAVRAPLIVVALGALIFTLPPQVIEIFRAVSLDSTTNMWPAIKSLVALTAVALIFSFLGHELIQDKLRFRKNKSWVDATCLVAFPIILGAVLPLSVLIGLRETIATIPDFPSGDLSSTPDLNAALSLMESGRSRIQLGSALCALITLGAVIFSLVMTSIDSKRLRVIRPIAFKPATAIAIILLIGVQIWLIVVTPVETTLEIGLFPLVFEFLAIIAYLSTLLTFWIGRFGWPVVSLTLLAAVAFSAFNINDNHTIDTVPWKGDGQVGQERPFVADAFDAWYKSRADRDAYKSGAYPVFIVAAAGGGLYAALHASTVLTRLQDRCPNFAQHVFAISGVSGGSLGAALFAALTQKFAKNQAYSKCVPGHSNEPGPFERKATAYLKNDFLTPLVGAALFPDFLQRFLPFPVKQFDRARALQEGFSSAWNSVDAVHNDSTQLNPFTQPFLSMWKAVGATPALVLNVTNVETGSRSALTPFGLVEGLGDAGNLAASFQTAGLKDFYAMNGLGFLPPDATTKDVKDLTLSTAVSLSARFPWITPAATLTFHDPDHTSRFVDGGYFENSGIEGAVDLISTIKDPGNDSSKLKVRVYLIVVTSAGVGTDSWNGLGEILSPIRAMLGTRATRGKLAVSRAMENNAVPISLVLLDLDAFPTPLGWQLSKASQLAIAEQSGYPGRNIKAGSEKLSDTGWVLFDTIQTNDIETCGIEAFLDSQYDSTATARDVCDQITYPNKN
jgi:hypothetical protein